jgi:NAD(P)-dependent dehydrogenase (short-subunit alcohol dehydrogenase family)
MSAGKSVQDKVIVVTGGGRGVGRAIALLAAAEGAKVVVNDLGGDTGGVGADRGVAQSVVDEIVASGGTAVANGDSVADPAGAANIVGTAIKTYGKIDCVINNAGILRDRMFHNMTNEEWDAVIKVHLYGCFYMSKAAAPYFKEQKSGSYVHYTSTSGLMGNTGQSNYMAAKLGIVGLSRGIAMDMARHNVRSNCIAPFAWSRLIGSIPVTTPEMAREMEISKERLTPERIAPLPVFLASDAASSVSGQIFAARSNEIYLFSQPRVVRSVHRDGGWTPTAIAETMLPSFKNSFYELKNMMEFFPWDPI